MSRFDYLRNLSDEKVSEELDKAYAKNDVALGICAETELEMRGVGESPDHYLCNNPECTIDHGIH